VVVCKNIFEKIQILSRTFPFSKRYSYIEGQKEPSIPLRTLKAEYPNHRLHKTDLAATQGASAGASRLWREDTVVTAVERPQRPGEVAWNTYLKRRVSNHDTHRGDALKASAVLPTMWYRKWELLPAAEQVVRPYIREVVSNRV